MRLRRLEIENFRGIVRLDWRHIGETTALVGPGDSCKSTVLDAIERVLSPRWNFAFDDSDFHSLETKDPIRICATVTEGPKAFVKETRFGIAIQALTAEGTTAAATKQTDKNAFAWVIELRVDASLEPQWNVIDAGGGPHPISAKDRELLGMIRVGTYVDAHLGWGRGSALARLTERGDSVAMVLADAARRARHGFPIDGLDNLRKASSQAVKIAGELGVAMTGSLEPHLDVGALAMGSGALALHDGDVPMRRAGLGTRRLLAMALQRDAGAKEGLALVDEIEHGLEPHRIRRLLRVLRGKAPEPPDGKAGQLIFTTHSPTVLSELTPDEVCVVRRDGANHTVTVTAAPNDLRTVLVKVPGALVARRVVVGEGVTEQGFVLALGEAWEAAGQPSLAYRGVEVVDGLGSDMPAKIAGALARVGYTTALLVDSDGKAKTSKAEGAKLLQWAGIVAIEERIALDLPEEDSER
ncbi:MAG: AAA family ATPase [Myxococcota bacterium]